MKDTEGGKGYMRGIGEGIFKEMKGIEGDVIM